MIKHITYTIALGVTAVIAANSTIVTAHSKKYTEVDALLAAKPVGSAFTRALTTEYKDFSKQQRDGEDDYPDAIHFARKGLATAKGHRVMPEPIKDWDLKLGHLRQLTSARARLITAFKQGGRSTAPELAAKAQARFDCWIEKREENRAPNANISCRTQFEAAVNRLERQLPVGVPVPETAAMPPVEADTSQTETQTAIEQAVFLAFFDFDKADISSGGADVLSSVADEIKNRDDITTVNVIGYTDTSGPESYNMKLSLRRAKAVREALVKRGVSKDLIEIDNKGERELLIPTPDNVREPANRRARISFE